MTVDSDGSLLTSLEFFEGFGERYRSGLANRIEDEIEVDGPEITPETRASVAAAAPHGGLLGRTGWGGVGAERVGCVLWTGDLPFLIGDEEREPGPLMDGDAEALDSHLRLNVEEGGDGPVPVDWKTLRAVPGPELEEAMRKAGIADECEVATMELRMGERRIAFRFLVATEEAEPEVEEVPALAEEPAGVGEATVPETPALSGLSVLEEAADLGLGGGPETGPPITGERRSDPEGPSSEELQNLQHLLDVRMPLTIRLGSTRMNLDRLLRLVPGAILELDQREETPLEVLANGHVIARGEVVVLDERFGLRITEIGGAEERLRATL